MSLVMKATAGGGVHIPPGTYRVVCSGVVEDKVESPYGQPDVIRFSLTVADQFDEEGNPVDLDGIASRKLSPKAKLTSWLNAFGIEVAIGQDVDLEMAVGLEAYAVVIDHEKDGATFSRVSALIPLPETRATTVANIADLPLTDWWKACTERSFTVIEMRTASQKKYGQLPQALTGQERAELLAAMPVT